MDTIRVYFRESVRLTSNLVTSKVPGRGLPVIDIFTCSGYERIWGTCKMNLVRRYLDCSNTNNN